MTSVDGHADRDQLAEYRAAIIDAASCSFCGAQKGTACGKRDAGGRFEYVGYVHDDRSLVHIAAVRRAALLEAADKIQALHPGERKASVELLQDMARTKASKLHRAALCDDCPWPISCREKGCAFREGVNQSESISSDKARSGEKAGAEGEAKNPAGTSGHDSQG